MSAGSAKAEEIIRRLQASGLDEAAQGTIAGALAVMSYGMLPLAQKVMGTLPRRDQEKAARLLGEMIGDALVGALKDGWSS